MGWSDYRIDLGCLVAGEAARTDVQAPGGERLVEEGEVMDATRVAAVRDACGGYFLAPAAWTNVDREDTEAVVAQFGRRPEAKGGPQRVHARSSLCVTAQITFGDTDDRRTVRVTACDISRGGFGFVLDGFVHPGTRVEGEIGPARHGVRAIVRSCTHLQGMRHRVGVEFIRSQSEAA